jgi:hypothetical protein
LVNINKQHIIPLRKERDYCTKTNNQISSFSYDRLILRYVDDDELDNDEDLFVCWCVDDEDIIVIAVNCGDGDENNNVSFNDDENDGFLSKDFFRVFCWK